MAAGGDLQHGRRLLAASRRAGARLPLLLLLAAAPPDAAPLPRLAGVVVSPVGRAAIFDGVDGQWWVSGEGDAVGRYTVRSIAPGRVVVDGPGGIRVLRPVPGASDDRDADQPDQAGTLTPAQAGAIEAGEEAGTAAVRYDTCVAGGELPDDHHPAEPQVTRMLATMAALPAQAGVDARDMAAWMRLGLDTARRAAAAWSVEMGAGCGEVAKAWRSVARRYGFAAPPQ